MYQPSYYAQSSASFVALSRGTERGSRNRYTNDPLTESTSSAVPQESISPPRPEWSDRSSSAVPSFLNTGQSIMGHSAGDEHDGSFRSSTTPYSEQDNSNEQDYNSSSHIPYSTADGSSNASISRQSASAYTSKNQPTYGDPTQSSSQYTPNDVNDMNESAMSSHNHPPLGKHHNDGNQLSNYALEHDEDARDAMWNVCWGHKPAYSSKRPLFPPEAPTFISQVQAPELHCPKTTHGSVPAESQTMSWVERIDEKAQILEDEASDTAEDYPYAPSDSWAPSPSENANFSYQNSGFNQNAGFITQYVMPWNGPD